MVSQSISSKRMRETQVWILKQILCRLHLLSLMIAELSFSMVNFMASLFINPQRTRHCRATNHLNSATKRTILIFKILRTILFSLSSSNLNSFLYTIMKTTVIKMTIPIYNNSSSKWRSLWQRELEIGFVLLAKTSIFHSERSATDANRIGSKTSNTHLKPTTSRCLLAIMECLFPTITCSLCNLTSNKFSSIIHLLPPLKFSSTSTSSNQFSFLEFKISPNSCPQLRISSLATPTM